MISAVPTPAGLKIPTREPMHDDLIVAPDESQADTWFVKTINQELLGTITFEGDYTIEQQRQVASRFGADLVNGTWKEGFIYTV